MPLFLVVQLVAALLARPKPLNEYVLRRVAAYPTDGTYQYGWKAPWHGTTREIVYDGRLVARGEPKHTYCCGLVFEVALGALTDAWGERVPGLDGRGAAAMRRAFCGADRRGPERLVVDGVLEAGLGRAVEHDAAEPGDLAQLWRRDGHGHTVVFLNWIYEDERRVGLHYWSTQPVTRGIGFRTERFDRDGVMAERIYLVRMHAPAVRMRGIEPPTSRISDERSNR